MNGFERRRERTKECIQQAALELFKAHGSKKVSISEIASKAGVSQVTIYNHFGSKEKLVRNVAEKFILSLWERYREVLEGDLPYLEKLEYICLDKAKVTSQHHGEFLQTMVSNDPEIRRFVESMYQQEVNQRLVDFFEEGKRQGYVDPERSQEAILAYTEIFRNGLAASSVLTADSEHNALLVRDLMAIYLYGLMGKAKKPSLVPASQERKGNGS
jgi:AcrR family transcriptional regulator